jgi:hypothetical protein
MNSNNTPRGVFLYFIAIQARQLLRDFQSTKKDFLYTIVSLLRVVEGIGEKI